MALQGSLRDFSAMEILQLVGSQKKSGCLVMEWENERIPVWVIDGRIVSTRQPGLTREDPLARFLRQVKRLSDEQFRGLLIIQKESGRDFEDLLVNGRYVEAEDLAGLIERQILEDLTRLVRWESGSYRFDPSARWPGEPVVSLSTEGVLMEAARRVDEQRRFATVFRDPHKLLAVHDLPDPDESLTDEERELFGIVDGQRTLVEVVAAAPLSEFEAHEALHRMLEARWIQFTGRRAPGMATPVAPKAPAAPVRRPPRPRRSLAWVREVAVGVAVLAVVAIVRSVAPQPHVAPHPEPEHDVHAIARLRDLRHAVELFARERGEYPKTLHDLVDDRWIEPAALDVPGYAVRYSVLVDGGDFELALDPAR